MGPSLPRIRPWVFSAWFVVIGLGVEAFLTRFLFRRSLEVLSETLDGRPVPPLTTFLGTNLAWPFLFWTPFLGGLLLLHLYRRENHALWLGFSVAVLCGGLLLLCITVFALFLPFLSPLPMAGPHSAR